MFCGNAILVNLDRLNGDKLPVMVFFDYNWDSILELVSSRVKAKELQA